MKNLSYKDIEGIAEQVFALYKELPEIKDKPVYRVEPELLLEKLLGLKTRYFHMTLDSSVLGLTSYGDIELFFNNGLDENSYKLDGKTVLIESDLNDDFHKGRRNFTIMHEGAHHILRIVYPTEYDTNFPTVHYHKANQGQYKQITDWEEWQADTLASALLMPKEVVRDGMLLVGLPDKIPLLSKACPGGVYNKFCILAEFIGVSKKALAIRLKQLGIVVKEFIYNPYEVIDIYEED